MIGVFNYVALVAFVCLCEVQSQLCLLKATKTFSNLKTLKHCFFRWISFFVKTKKKFVLDIKMFNALTVKICMKVNSLHILDRLKKNIAVGIKRSTLYLS